MSSLKIKQHNNIQKKKGKYEIFLAIFRDNARKFIYLNERFSNNNINRINGIFKNRVELIGFKLSYSS